MDDVEAKINSLKKSKFRSSFHLKKSDKDYISKKGIEIIREHAYDFVVKRLSLPLANDGKQTPYRGHPVFIAQHATATCCRGCLFKWHHIPKNRELTKTEIDYIVNLIMRWLEGEYMSKGEKYE